MLYFSLKVFFWKEFSIYASKRSFWICYIVYSFCCQSKYTIIKVINKHLSLHATTICRDIHWYSTHSLTYCWYTMKKKKLLVVFLRLNRKKMSSTTFYMLQVRKKFQQNERIFHCKWKKKSWKHTSLYECLT